MPYIQDNRLIAIETPLGKDALLLTGFRGTEGLSTPFSFELDLLSENHSIPFKDIIGKKRCRFRCIGKRAKTVFSWANLTLFTRTRRRQRGW